MSQPYDSVYFLVVLRSPSLFSACEIGHVIDLKVVFVYPAGLLVPLAKIARFILRKLRLDSTKFGAEIQYLLDKAICHKVIDAKLDRANGRIVSKESKHINPPMSL
ncbi:hypothetical protein CDL15_Pgr006973 [Punica granatum]|uniref:Uncharacterized protein n=1 Tax=Punica granatum TaxID=22663 RepID=A0A218X980_PUNGR|nr:hypothetical protein CDL15_Pgr006973 [Punica granatum]